MDILGLLRELSNSGISDVVLLVVIPLLVRYWISEAKADLRKELDESMDSKLIGYQQKMDVRFDANDKRFDQIDARLDRQDKRTDLLYQQNVEIAAHLMDLRERLANIEGRMGIYPPRRVSVELPRGEQIAEPEGSPPSAN